MATTTTTTTPEGSEEPAALPPDWDAIVALHTALTALAGLVVTVLWGVTGAGYYWPVWVWFGLGLPLALHATVRFACLAPAGRTRGLAIHAGVTGVIAVALVALWGLTSGPTFWPAWPILSLAAFLALHGIIHLYLNRVNSPERERRLVERVDELTRTRRGALDVQAAELRRIERDLHDGAQARLVALSMHLGRAEAKLDDRPEVAEMVRQAKGEASAAIAELRDLARGIAPPILADRGLEEAIAALGRRAAMPVVVDVELKRRQPPVVESAAYFIVAEGLTNAAKHAAGGGTTARVRVAEEIGRLVVEIADDGPGGADPEGTGLTGLRHRAEALDGTLSVESAPGTGTLVRAELPCVP
jgi:signal transduction histidine kinase